MNQIKSPSTLRAKMEWDEPDGGRILKTQQGRPKKRSALPTRPKKSANQKEERGESKSSASSLLPGESARELKKEIPTKPSPVYPPGNNGGEKARKKSISVHPPEDNGGSDLQENRNSVQAPEKNRASQMNKESKTTRATGKDQKSKVGTNLLNSIDLEEGDSYPDQSPPTPSLYDEIEREILMQYDTTDEVWWTLPLEDVPGGLYGEWARVGEMREHRKIKTTHLTFSPQFCKFVVETVVQNPRVQIECYGNGNEGQINKLVWKSTKFPFDYCVRDYHWYYNGTEGKPALPALDHYTHPYRNVPLKHTIPAEHFYLMMTHQLDKAIDPSKRKSATQPNGKREKATTTIYENPNSTQQNSRTPLPISSLSNTSIPSTSTGLKDKKVGRQRDTPKSWEIRRDPGSSYWADPGRRTPPPKRDYYYPHRGRSHHRSSSRSKSHRPRSRDRSHHSYSSHKSSRTHHHRQSHEKDEKHHRRHSSSSSREDKPLNKEAIRSLILQTLSEKDSQNEEGKGRKRARLSDSIVEISKDSNPIEKKYVERSSPKPLINIMHGDLFKEVNEMDIESNPEESEGEGNAKKRKRSENLNPSEKRMFEFGTEYHVMANILMSLGLTPNYRPLLSSVCVPPAPGIKIGNHYRFLAPRGERRIVGKVHAPTPNAPTIMPSEIPKNILPEDIAKFLGIPIKMDITQSNMKVPMLEYKNIFISEDGLKAAEKRQYASFFPPMSSHPPRDTIPNDIELFEQCQKIEQQVNRQFGLASALLAKDNQLALSLTVDSLTTSLKEREKVLALRKTEGENKIHKYGEDSLTPLSRSEMEQLRREQLLNPVTPTLSGAKGTASMQAEQKKAQIETGMENKTTTIPTPPPPPSTITSSQTPQTTIQQPAYPQIPPQVVLPYPSYPSYLPPYPTGIPEYSSQFFPWGQPANGGTSRRSLSSSHLPQFNKTNFNPKNRRRRP
jgi:hypothetical protein